MKTVIDTVTLALRRTQAQRQLPAPAQRRLIRHAAGVSLEAIARELNVTPTTVWRWEHGQRVPRDPERYLKLLHRIAAEGIGAFTTLGPDSTGS